MRTLIIGMKTVVWSLTNFQGGAQQSQQMGQPPTTSGFREGELRRASGFVANGVRCLALYQGAGARRCARTSPRPWRCSTLAISWTSSASDWTRCWAAVSLRAPADGAAAHLLCCRPRSDDAFADALATHLVRDRLPALSEPRRRVAARAQALFAAHARGEQVQLVRAVLSPHDVPLVEACLKAMGARGMTRARTSAAPVPVPRARAGQVRPAVPRRVVRVLQPTLDALLALLHGPERTSSRDTVVELCLTRSRASGEHPAALARLAHPCCARSSRPPPSCSSSVCARWSSGWTR